MVGLTAMGLYTLASHAQNATADEYEIRAAMLYNLTKFIDWPAWKNNQVHPAFQFCMLGSDPLGANLEILLQGKVVNGQPVILRHLGPSDNLDDCHILYVGAGERKRVASAAAELAKHAVLTVSERPNSDNAQQIIGLPTSEEHVHIDVNLGAAQRSGLKISSKLLQLATVNN